MFCDYAQCRPRVPPSFLPDAGEAPDIGQDEPLPATDEGLSPDIKQQLKALGYLQ